MEWVDLEYSTVKYGFAEFRRNHTKIIGLEKKGKSNLRINKKSLVKKGNP